MIHGHRAVLQRVATLGLPVPGEDLPAEVREPAGPADPFADPGPAQKAYLEQAVASASAGDVDALLTAPVDKARLAAAGFTHPGHTDFLAASAGADVAMVFLSPTLIVVPATVHLPYAEVPRALAERLAPTVEILSASLVSDFGKARPRVAVAGLNPHAGEQGLLGAEEQRIMAPALDAARSALADRGLDVEVVGPLSGDTVFAQAAAGGFDAVVAAYHDQALIPVKLLAFADAVNFTAGLPYVRTSPAHGTAPDLAWTGNADPSSTRAALRWALDLAGRRRNTQK